MSIVKCFTELDLLKVVSALIQTIIQFLTNMGWRFFTSKFLIDLRDDRTSTLVFEVIKLGFIPKSVFLVVLLSEKKACQLLGLLRQSTQKGNFAW